MSSKVNKAFVLNGKENESKHSSNTSQNWESGTGASAATTFRKKTKYKPPVPTLHSLKNKTEGLLPERKVSSSSETSYETESQNATTQPTLKRRNLQVSDVISKIKGNQSSRFIPAAIAGFTEMQLAFKTPKNKLGITQSPDNWQSRVHVFDGVNESDSDTAIRYDPHDPRRDIDAVNEARKLKAKLLAGKHVSIHDIQAVKCKMLPAGHHEKNTRRYRRLHKDMDVLKRKKLFCVKGIVHVPTPHKVHVPFNTFGSPADLRISLSNQDTPEFKGRRRLFFDFSEFRDEEIKLSLESSRRLVIEAKHDSNSDSKLNDAGSTKSRTEIIDLPRDLPVDNLRIVRDAFGNIIVEEAWKFR